MADPLDATPLELRPYTAPTGEEIWRNVLDFTTEIEAYRAEHGPFLKELRCGEVVLTHLTLTLPREDRKPWGPAPWGVPVVKDEDVPARHLRFVFDDGTVEDHVAINEAQELLIQGLLGSVERVLQVEFAPPMPNSYSDIYRYGLIAKPPTINFLRGITGV